MSAIVPSLRALIRAELAALRLPELGVVTRVYTNDGGKGEVANEVDLRLRGSTVELQRVPVLVGRLGFSCVPCVDDLVMIAFVGGDLNAPVVIGSLYDERVLAPDAGPDELVYTVPDNARDGARRFELQLPNSRTVTIEDAKVTIAMGKTTITIEADGAIKMEAGGDLVLKASGAVSIEATGAATLKGSSVTVEGTGEAKLKGATTTIAGTTNFSAT
jgi:phage baseplate assembly protein gpV